MGSIKTLMTDTFGRLLFREVTIVQIDQLSPHFRRFRLQSESLRGRAAHAGDKVQVLISRHGTRTYTPFACDPTTGQFHFLVYVHGDSPGACWARDAKVGEVFRAFGPRGSLALAGLSGPVALFGDETSLAAAAALTELRRSRGDLHFALEVSSQAESAPIVAALGLPNVTLFERRPDQSHLREVEAALREFSTPQTTLIMTGCAQAIQTLRARLKSPRLEHAGQSVKAYWSVGKTGLD